MDPVGGSGVEIFTEMCINVCVSTTPKPVNVSKPYLHLKFVWCSGWFLCFLDTVGGAGTEIDISVNGIYGPIWHIFEINIY